MAEATHLLGLPLKHKQKDIIGLIAELETFLKRDGSRRPTGDIIPDVDGLKLGSATLTKRWDIPAVKSTTVITNLNADRLDGSHRTIFARGLNLFPFYFIPAEITVETIEVVLDSFSFDVSSLEKRFMFPQYSATYRWTDLAGGNPLCTLRFYSAKTVDTDTPPTTWRALNYIEFQGVDLFKHPVHLTRQLVDYNDYIEFSGGVTGEAFWFEVRAVASAGALKISNRSLAPLYSSFFTT